MGEVLSHSGVKDRGGEFDETSIGGHEVGLAAQHDHGAVVAAALSQHATFVGVAVSTFSSHFLTLLTEEVNSLFEIAIAFYEGLFAVHHTDTRQLTKLINLFCSNICHSGILFFVLCY